jgi:hypothetical protein
MLRRFWLWLWPDDPAPKRQAPRRPHTWTAWTIVEDEEAEGFPAFSAASRTLQRRRCTQCGFTDEATLRSQEFSCTSQGELA